MNTVNCKSICSLQKQFLQNTALNDSCYRHVSSTQHGDVAERLGRALQKLVQRFKSARLLFFFCFIELYFDMGTTADLRSGAVIKYNNEPCLVLESTHRTPGNLRAFYQVRMRNLRSGKNLEERFRSGETIDFLRVERRDYQFLYREGTDFVFMDNETYDQVNVSEKSMGDAGKFLKEGATASISFNDTEVLQVELPPHVILRITESEPGIKGDSANNNLKPATMETGAIVSVPLFVNQGDLIRIDTRTGDYMERVKE